MRGENMLKTRLVLSNRQNFSPFMAVAVAKHDGIQTRYKFNTVSKLQ